MKRVKDVPSFLGLLFFGFLSLVCSLIGCVLIFIGFVIGWIGDLITWIARVAKKGGKSTVDFADRIISRKE